MSATPIIDFVQDNYSSLGVSVKSYGKDSILLNLPADCTDISSIVVELVDQFDVSIDFNLDPDPVLCCWFSNFKTAHNSKRLVWPHILQALVIFALLLLVFLASQK